MPTEIYHENFEITPAVTLDVACISKAFAKEPELFSAVFYDIMRLMSKKNKRKMLENLFDTQGDYQPVIDFCNEFYKVFPWNPPKRRYRLTEQCMRDMREWDEDDV